MPQSQPQKLKPVSSSPAAEPAGNLELFKSKVQGYIRLSRNSQKELAEALGLHPKVLGRKLSSNSVALLSRPEVSEIVKTLAKWRAILTQDEANELLTLMNCPPFTPEEWREPPLDRLEGAKTIFPHDLKEDNYPVNATQDYVLTTPPLFPTTTPATNLPTPLTSFVGREREIARLTELLVPAEDAPPTRLVTLTGTGGAGKSRLSFEVASLLLHDFVDGIWLVELAAINDPTILPRTIAETLEINEQANRPILKTLTEALKQRQLLLLLDNCEHLIEACARVVNTLLRACPGLQILATSREALRVPGEVVFRVPPLALPDSQNMPALDKLLDYEAIRLFVDRAKIANSYFSVSEHNSLDLVQLCRRLDGIPLAIELAAARTNLLTVGQINARLDDRFRLLKSGNNRTASPRQRTLRGLIDWSYNSLSEPEKHLFRRLSIFSGGFSLEAAEIIGGGDGVENFEVLDLLSQLVNKSLIAVEEMPENPPRYHYLETLREYAQEQLTASGESEPLRRKHFDYFVGLAEEAYSNTVGVQQVSWFARLDREQDNLRMALSWANENQGFDSAIQLSGALGRYWYVRCYYSEGLNWLQTLLPHFTITTDRRSKEHQARALYWMATLAMPLGQYQQATPLYERSLALSRELDDKRNITGILNRLGELARNQGRYQQATSLLEESLAHARQLGDLEVIANALCNYGEVAWDLGNYEQAQNFYQEGFEVFSRLQDQIGIAKAILRLGQVERIKGQYRQAQIMLEQSYSMFEQRLNLWGMASTLHRQGLVAFDLGDYARARQLFEESLALFSQHGDKWGRAEQLADLGNVSLARGELAEAVRFFEDSLSLYREIGIRSRIANLVVSQGEVAFRQGDYDRAKSILKEGLEVQNELSTKPGIAKALRLLGEVAYQERDYCEALNFFNQSLKFNLEMNDRLNLALNFERLAATHLALNESEKAAQFAQEAATIRAATGVPAKSGSFTVSKAG